MNQIVLWSIGRELGWRYAGPTAWVNFDDPLPRWDAELPDD